VAQEFEIDVLYLGDDHRAFGSSIQRLNVCEPELLKPLGLCQKSSDVLPKTCYATSVLLTENDLLFWPKNANLSGNSTISKKELHKKAC
jgi:hypothetical protein